MQVLNHCAPRVQSVTRCAVLLSTIALSFCIAHAEGTAKPKTDAKPAKPKTTETAKPAETKPAEVKAEKPTTPTVLLLDSTEKVWALQVSAGGKLVVQKGNVIIDSTHEKALWNASSSVEVKDGQIGIVGGWFHLGEAKTEPEPFVEIESVADPLAELKLTMPENVASGKQWFITEQGEVTLRPGVYRGGVFAANTHLKLEPGVYVVENGNFFMSNCTVEGKDVTFVLTGDRAGTFWTAAGSQLDLAAPTSGDFKNLVVVSYAKGTNQVNLGGGAKARFAGTIYAPESGVEVAHGSEIKADRIIALNLGISASSLELTGADNSAAEAPKKEDKAE